MTKRMMSITLATCLLGVAAVHAGTGLYMKCQVKPETDPATGEMSKPCGHEEEVTFGGGMAFQQMTGYCRQCKRFVHLSWTQEGLSPEMIRTLGINKVTPRPNPLGEVWDAQTGKVLAIHACPTCKGPFLEIKGPDELKHCPACNKPHFGVDKSRPVKAID